MPDKPLTIATYAAGASLAAITLVYVFGPTFFLDDEAAQSSRASRKKGVVGLVNPANDCFINSVLQTLAGLPELRVYLIRELHRRQLDGRDIYAAIAGDSEDETEALDTEAKVDERRLEKKRNNVKMPEWKVLGEQRAMVTAALKEVLDSLNERPIYKKTISAQSFVAVLEQAFRTRISRQQQDAQEFLQLVTERLSDEYYAGRKARRKAESRNGANGRINGAPASQPEPSDAPSGLGVIAAEDLENRKPQIMREDDSRRNILNEKNGDHQDDQGFPFEGKIEAQIECSFCGFKPKPSISSFVTLTLHVPQLSSTSLNACFDGMLKIEHIDDFKCDRCRLQYAVEMKQRELAKSSLRLQEGKTAGLKQDLAALQHALATDPESPPPNVILPDISLAPKRRISRHMRISTLPRILAVHLSRSMWDTGSMSTKNMAKVSFPEKLPMGGLLDQKMYTLLGVVTHKGGHNSGHYESFRRQILREPYSTRASLGTEGIYSAKGSPKPSALSSPALAATSSKSTATSDGRPETPVASLSPSMPSDSSTSLSSRSSQSRSKLGQAQSAAPPVSAEVESPAPLKKTESARAKSLDMSRFKRKAKKDHNRWWRISDDKIKESKTSEVLGMQKEVYLLFYELVPPEDV